MNTFNLMTKANHQRQQQLDAAMKRRYARQRKAAFRQKALTVAADLALVSACTLVLLGLTAWCL